MESAPDTCTAHKVYTPAPRRISVASKKVTSVRPPSTRSPSYTDSLDGSDRDAEASLPTAHTTASAQKVHSCEDVTRPVEADTADDDDNAEGYYILRERPSLTVAERVERLKAAQADALRERAVAQLPAQGIARRPATLVRSRHGTVRSRAIAPRPPAGDPPPERTLAIEATPSPPCELSTSPHSVSRDSLDDDGRAPRSSEGKETYTRPADSAHGGTSHEDIDATSAALHAPPPSGGVGTVGSASLLPLDIDRDEDEDLL